MVAWLRARGASDPIVASELGTIHARHVVLRAMSVSVTALVARGEHPLLEAAVVKDLGTQVEQEIAETAQRIAFADPHHPAPASGARGARLRDADGTHFLSAWSCRDLRGMIARALGSR